MHNFLSILFFLISSTAFASDLIPPDKEIIIFQDLKVGPVTFEHKLHSTLEDIKCTTCHHTTTEQGQPEDCHNCHDPVVQGQTPKSSAAFHIRCRGCHQYTVREGRKAGPAKKCTLCHLKDEAHDGQ